MITVSYYNHGYQYTEKFTLNQAKRKLIEYGYSNVKKMTSSQVFDTLQEIYDL